MKHPEDHRSAILGGTPAFPDGPPVWPVKQDAIKEVFERIWANGSWGQYLGPHCDALIEFLKNYLDVEHVRLCSGGTAAVELALRGLSIQKDDEVILAAYDFQANLNNVLALNAKPVLVDIRADDWQVDVEQIQNAITTKTKAILVSHLHGALVDMPKLREIADEQKIPVIEDACQVTGATIHGRQTGTWGDVGILSTGGSKLITASRGGIIYSNNAQIMQRIKLWVERGNDLSPFSELQAALVLPQIELLDEWNHERLKSASYVQSKLSSFSGIEVISNTLDNSLSAYYKLGIKFDPSLWSGLSRDQFSIAIREEGVALFPGFEALHRMTSKRRFEAVGDLKVSEEAADRILVLHHPILLEEESSLDQIVFAIQKIKNEAKEIVQHFSNQK